MVNDLAGTTRDPVDEVVTVDGEDWLFIDTAGIKRRLHKLSGAEYFSSLRTQAAIERSELALVLFDASQPISDQDLKVMSQAVDAGRCIVLVFNKWDLMDDFDRQRMERLWKTEFDRVTWAQRVNLSAKTDGIRIAWPELCVAPWSRGTSASRPASSTLSWVRSKLHIRIRFVVASSHVFFSRPKLRRAHRAS